MEVGQTTRRKGCGLPDGGGDTSADSAACCTLRPESARNRGKSAANSWSELAAGDATAASLDVAEDAEVGAPSAVAQRTLHSSAGRDGPVSCMLQLDRISKTRSNPGGLYELGGPVHHVKKAEPKPGIGLMANDGYVSCITLLLAPATVPRRCLQFSGRRR